jgi:hypothetical protein
LISSESCVPRLARRKTEQGTNVKKLTTLALLAGLVASGPASATLISGTSLQDQLNAAGALVNVHTDQYNPDEVWQIGATGLAGARLLFELAGFANENTFGVYDIANSHNQLTIFQGSSAPRAQGLLQANGAEFCAGLVWGAPTCSTFTSHLFGFFLATPNGTFYSETKQNGDGTDHMVAFQGGTNRGTVGGSPWMANEFILAWEDIFGGGDRDFDDFGVLVESIISVSEPASLALFGLGMFALVAVSRRRIRTRI